MQVWEFTKYSFSKVSLLLMLEAEVYRQEENITRRLKPQENRMKIMPFLIASDLGDEGFL